MTTSDADFVKQSADFAREAVEESVAYIVDLMQRHYAAEQSSAKDCEEIEIEIREHPSWVHIPGEAKKSGDTDAEPSEADELDAVIIDLSGEPGIRVVLSPMGDTEMQYCSWRMPWATLPLSPNQQSYLDGFGAEFAWMREEFGTPAPKIRLPESDPAETDTLSVAFTRPLSVRHAGRLLSNFSLGKGAITERSVTEVTIKFVDDDQPDESLSEE